MNSPATLARLLLLALLVAAPATGEEISAPTTADDATVTAASTDASPGMSKPGAYETNDTAFRLTASNGALQLDTTAVTGTRELPRVMVIVPWKNAEIGAPGGRPLASLVEDVLTPLDPDVFRRELLYFTSLSEDAEPGMTRGASSDNQ